MDLLPVKTVPGARDPGDVFQQWRTAWDNHQRGVWVLVSEDRAHDAFELLVLQHLRDGDPDALLAFCKSRFRLEFDAADLISNWRHLYRHQIDNAGDPGDWSVFEQYVGQYGAADLAPLLCSSTVMAEFTDTYLGAFNTVAEAVDWMLKELDDVPPWFEERVGGDGTRSIWNRLTETNWVITVWDNDGQMRVWLPAGRLPAQCPEPDDIRLHRIAVAA